MRNLNFKLSMNNFVKCPEHLLQQIWCVSSVATRMDWFDKCDILHVVDNQTGSSVFGMSKHLVFARVIKHGGSVVSEIERNTLTQHS